MELRRGRTASLGCRVLLAVLAALGCAREDRRAHSASSGAGAATSKTVPSMAVLAPWTFAVLSDLHIPRDGHVTSPLRHAADAVIRIRPRFVVITGDFTDGNPFDPSWRRLEAPRWWEAVRELVSPIRAAGIPVLPIAGNHDSYLAVYRADYAKAWRDLGVWALPLRVHDDRRSPFAPALDAAPFSYAVDVDGVHLTLAHIVDESLDPSVASWLARDLAAAKGARLRIVFGHVPLASVASSPRRSFVDSLGRILGVGHADLYVAGHEHLVWDEDVSLPGGRRVEQVIVGSASAPWRFGPGAAARQRAACVEEAGGLCCTMPHGGTVFELRLERGAWYQTQARTFTLFTVDGNQVTARAIAIREDGGTEPFGRSEACARRRALGDEVRHD